MPLFVDLLNKGRSAGMAITISHQSMRGDLAAAERGFVDQVADNTNIKICLRQSADAEYVAGLSGTYKTVKRTEQTLAALFGHERTGLGSAREVDEYHVSPNLIRQPSALAINGPGVLGCAAKLRLVSLFDAAIRSGDLPRFFGRRYQHLVERHAALNRARGRPYATWAVTLLSRLVSNCDNPSSQATRP